MSDFFFFFFWCLNLPTNNLWAPWPGDQVHQLDKAGPQHRFPSCPLCDIQAHQCHLPMPLALVLCPGLQERPLPVAIHLLDWSCSFGAPIFWLFAWYAMSLSSSKACDCDKSFTSICSSKYNVCGLVGVFLKNPTRRTYSAIYSAPALDFLGILYFRKPP